MPGTVAMLLRGVRAGMRERTSRRRRSGPVHVGKALDTFARRLGIDRTIREHQVIASWGALVGEQVARVTTPQRFEKGVLTVAVSSAPWRSELTLRRREIMEKINAAAGKPVVRDIRFR